MLSSVFLKRASRILQFSAGLIQTGRQSSINFFPTFPLLGSQSGQFDQGFYEPSRQTTMFRAIAAQQAPQPTFSSAAEATQSLFQAVQSNNEETIANILGGPTELTTSPDKGQDKADRELFVQKYQEMHRLGLEPDGSVTLYIGAENWPFPIPVV